MSTSKSNLRSCLKKSRKAFVKQEISAWRVGFDWPGQLIDLVSNARCVAGYMPVGSEADVTSLLHQIADRNVPIALPYLASPTANLMFRFHLKNEPLETALFGFKQPAATAKIAEPDVILTPLVGFDVAMARLGQGAGHYDRAFTRHPDALRIGIAWSIQQVERIPTDPWDVALDAVLTEKDWIIGKNSRIMR